MSQVVGAEWWRPAPPDEATVATLVSAPPQRSSGGTLAFWALIAFTFIMVLQPQAYLPVLRPFRIALLAAVVGIIASLADSLRHGRPVMVKGGETTLTAALVAWTIITMPLSYWPGGSVAWFLDLYVKTVAIFWLLTIVVNTPQRLRWVVWALALMTVPLVLTAVKNFLAGAFVQVGNPVKRILGYGAGIDGYTGGLVTNPNDMALLLNLILPLTVALLLATPSAATRTVLLGLVLLQAAAVVVTFSRAGFLTLATTSVLYLRTLVRRRRMGWAAAMVGFCLVGLLLLPHEYVARVATIGDINSDSTGSSQIRWTDTVAALQFIAYHPLVGAGIGMSILALNEARGAYWYMVHNVYLAYGMDLGLIGLALFLLLFLRCLKRVRSIRRGTPSEPELKELSWLAEGIEIALFAFGVAAFFHPVPYHFYFYYLAGLAVAAGAAHRLLTTRIDEARTHP
jgi:O-antigen ligase